jgi:hypothetical protein
MELSLSLPLMKPARHPLVLWGRRAELSAAVRGLNVEPVLRTGLLKS